MNLGNSEYLLKILLSNIFCNSLYDYVMPFKNKIIQNQEDNKLFLYNLI